jgi:type III restriction enzyme
MSPVRSRLRHIQSLIDDMASKLRKSHVTRLRQRTLLSEVDRRTLEQRSLQEQADALRGRLTDLSKEDRALLERGKAYEAADAATESWLGDLRSLADGAVKLRELAADSLATVPEPPDLNSESLKAAFEEFRSIMQRSDKLLGQVVDIAGGPANSIDIASSPWVKWGRAMHSFRISYTAAVQRSSAQKEHVEQLQGIEKQLVAHHKETRRLQEELRSLHFVETEYNELRQAWLHAVREYDDVLEEQCKTLTANAGGSIRASVRRFADASEFVERLRDALSGSNIRREKLEVLGDAITGAKSPEQQWLQIIDDLERLAEFNLERDGADQRPNTPALAACGLAVSDLNRIAARLSLDDWISLSLLQIERKPVFEYMSREGDYIAFDNASAGQQATALLKSLLNQIGPPLIIDQPEEDLDNPVMHEIVEQLWKAKGHRQIIFASHNANLVVNGDAELVVWCDYRKAGDQSLGKIAGEGAIDVSSVRDAIKRVMEGGEAAFKLRKEKYGF